jgi:hypothetical protein
MALYDFFLSRNNCIDVNDYVGHNGRLFYEAETGIIRISDGVTPGGRPIFSPILELSASRSETVVFANSDTPTVITGMELTVPSDGNYLVSFNSEYAVNSILTVTEQAADDLDTLYAALMALDATVDDHGAVYGSETLGPGVYDYTGASSVTGTLTLDAGGNADALFVFRCSGAFTTGVGAVIELINGATSSNVWFVSEGAASTGASAVFRGSLLANQAAVSVGAGTVMEGCMLAINGAAAVGAASTFTAPTGALTENNRSPTFENLFAVKVK